ncbi:MAG: GatB/YqeY domain-containing protein, partial [Luteitalea sp.]|nr:GatB/YqeY domain-containing protein [Luteitalea sp.]
TGASSPRDIGRVMKAAMARLAGQTVDGRTVNELVRRRLAG